MRRNIPVFASDQIDRLITLNRHLAQLEYWCLGRTRILVEDYKRIADSADARTSHEDFELELNVQYYRSLSSSEDREELILEISFLSAPMFKWYYLHPSPEHASDILEFLSFNWSDGVENIPKLNRERICWSFHDLHDHHKLDWQEILEIERVWLNLHAIHQVETQPGRPLFVLRKN